MAAIEEARRQEEVEARDLAEVTAFFEDRITSQGRPGQSLVILNRGPAVAQDILIVLTATGEGDTPILVGAEAELRLPRLDADGRFAWPALTHSGTARAIDVELNWRDGSGPRTNTVRLSMFG
jgi:hypothetical protein